MAPRSPVLSSWGHIGEKKKHVEYNSCRIYIDYRFVEMNEVISFTIKIAKVHVQNMIVLCNYNRIYNIQFTASS